MQIPQLKLYHIKRVLRKSQSYVCISMSSQKGELIPSSSNSNTIAKTIGRWFNHSNLNEHQQNLIQFFLDSFHYCTNMNHIYTKVNQLLHQINKCIITKKFIGYYSDYRANDPHQSKQGKKGHDGT